MNDPTFYLIGAYGVTALVIAIELFMLVTHRRRAIREAQRNAGNSRSNQL